MNCTGWIGRALLSAAACLSGCVESKALLLPSASETRGAQALILAWVDPTGKAGAYAVDLPRETTTGVSIPGGDTLVAIYYGIPLEKMAIAPGPIPPPPANDPGRLLPRGELAYQAPPAEGGGRTWSRVQFEDLAPALLELRIPSFTGADCEAKGGCFLHTAQADVCDLPCELPEPPASPVPPMPPELPAAPNPPELTPCPQGWSIVPPSSAETVETCAPPQSLGLPCPTGQWADAAEFPPGRPVRYVLAGALAGGTGTSAAPFGSIAEALGGAPPGAVLALSKGLFAETAVLTSSVTLFGACSGGAEATRIQGARVESEGVALINLRVTPDTASTGVRVDRAPATLILERVELEGGTVALAVAVPALVLARRISIQGSFAGVDVAGAGAHVHLQSAAIEGVAGDALHAGGGAEASATDLLVRGAGGDGLHIEENGSLTLARAAIFQSAAAGIAGDRATLHLTDVLIEDVAGGFGIVAEGSSTLELERAVIARAARFGAYVVSGSAAIASDLAVYDTQLFAGNNGEGLVVDGAQASFTRVFLARNHGFGATVLSSSTAAEATFIDLESDQTLYRELGGGLGAGLDLRGDVVVHLTRGRFLDNDGPGLRAANDPPSLEESRFEDVTVERSKAGGILIQGPGSITLDRARVEASAQNNITAELAATVAISDLISRGAGASGLSYDGGAMTVARALFENNAIGGVTGQTTDVMAPRTMIHFSDLTARNSGQYGVLFRDSEGSLATVLLEHNTAAGGCLYASMLAVTDLESIDTLRPVPSTPSCLGRNSEKAIGLVIEGRAKTELVFEADITLTRLHLADHADVGLDIGPYTTLMLHQALIERSAIGVQIGQAAPEALHFDDHVVFRGNRENIAGD